MQQTKLIRLFLYFSGILLTLAATAKFISAAGNAHILENPDPILSIAFKKVFWIVGFVELAVALVCFYSGRVVLKAGLVAWLATSVLVYRIGLLLVGYHKSCNCLGNLTDALHIPAQTADAAMKIILAYLLLGSYAMLFWLWRQKHKATLVAIAPNNTGSSAL